MIDAALWLANLRRIRTTEQVEKRFAKVGLRKTLPADEVAAYRHDQAELQRWLETLVSGERGRGDIEQVVMERLQTVDTRLSFAQGRLQYHYSLTGLQAALAFAVALILDERRGLRNRLQQCGNLNCQRFNLDFTPKGRPRRFCDEKCKRAADRQGAAERVRRHRAKKKARS